MCQIGYMVGQSVSICAYQARGESGGHGCAFMWHFYVGLILSLFRRALRKKRRRPWAQPPDSIRIKAEAAGQQHVFDDWATLTLEQQKGLVNQLEVPRIIFVRY